MCARLADFSAQAASLASASSRVGSSSNARDNAVPPSADSANTPPVHHADADTLDAVDGADGSLESEDVDVGVTAASEDSIAPAASPGVEEACVSSVTEGGLGGHGISTVEHADTAELDRAMVAATVDGNSKANPASVEGDEAVSPGLVDADGSGDDVGISLAENPGMGVREEAVGDNAEEALCSEPGNGDDLTKDNDNDDGHGSGVSPLPQAVKDDEGPEPADSRLARETREDDTGVVGGEAVEVAEGRGGGVGRADRGEREPRSMSACDECV